jgi:hypothetical protein
VSLVAIFSACIHGPRCDAIGRENAAAGSGCDDRSHGTTLSRLMAPPRNVPSQFKESTRSASTLVAIIKGVPSSRPGIHHSQPQNIKPANTATEFICDARLVNHVVSSIPISVETSNDEVAIISA